MPYLRAHLKPIGLLIATLFVALRPALFGDVHWVRVQWITFAIFAGGTFQAFAFANTNTTIAQYTKEIITICTAVLGSWVLVLPGGVHGDEWGVIVAAGGAAVWSVIAPLETPRAVLPEGT